jgi:hypothetical protein
VSARRRRRRRNAFRLYRQAAVVLALGASAAIMLSACAPKKSPTMEPISVNETKSEGAADAASAGMATMDEMNNLVSDLSQKAHDLPGRTAEAHRSAMHDVFDNLTKLLPILAGPEPSGGFRQQCRSVEAARDRLAPDAGDVNAEPAIDTGIRAAAAAFNDVAHDDDTFAGPDIAENLKKLSSTVDELDTVGGVGRPYVAADSVQLMAQIAHQMADKIGGMSSHDASTAAAGAPASTEPAASPAATTTEPAASEPAAKEPAAAGTAATEPAATPIEPKPAEQKAEGVTPTAEPAPAPDAAPAPEPAPAAEPNK